MILHPEESVNYGMCEDCFDEYLETDEEVTIKDFLRKKKQFVIPRKYEKGVKVKYE